MDDQGHLLFATLQLADSFFPTGMFTQSHGLEGFVAAGAADPAQIEALLHGYLLHVAAPGDALAARWVARAAQAGDLDLVAQIDDRLEATKLAPEGRVVSRRCGGRMLLLGADMFGGGLPGQYAARVGAGQARGHQAVALALLAAASGLDERAVVAIELHSFAVSIISAAVRLGALDHSLAQRLLLRAQPVLAEAASLGETLDWREIGGFAPWIELMQFQHAYADLHMFVS
ncbi:MAG TPA: urease accessory UreF family protein [Roseiflexaceae bacterium]|nr:urease accessory UreF family protein [Roseiflexaceae bacterium]